MVFDGTAPDFAGWATALSIHAACLPATIHARLFSADTMLESLIATKETLAAAEERLAALRGRL